MSNKRAPGRSLDEWMELVTECRQSEEYLKSPEEMAQLFPDHPEALATTLEIADKVEEYKLTPVSYTHLPSKAFSEAAKGSWIFSIP